jgi:hypothetical protein
VIGSSPITAVLGSAPANDSELSVLRSFIRAACTDAGLALLLIYPMGKNPVDLRTPQARSKDDKAAREAAKDAGRPDWIKARSKAGSHLASTDATLVTRYTERFLKTLPGQAPNFAIECSRSRLVIVDCDTAEQVAAFLADALITQPLPPTVSTPGAQDGAGNWIHRDGGHFYFLVPEDFDPGVGSGSWTAPGGYVVMWRDRYVLIPPSVRAEGAYTLTGRDYPLPTWLRKVIEDDATAREARRLAAASRPTDDALDANIVMWSQGVTWADILAPHGWTETERTDTCGCAIWTAPGEHSSPKSATTHDAGCDLGSYDDLNAPMYVWTDNPGEPFDAWITDSTRGSRTISKLRAYALLEFGGDIGKACAELGLLPGKDMLSFGEKEEFGVDPRGVDDGTVPANADEELTSDDLRTDASPPGDEQDERAQRDPDPQSDQTGDDEQPGQPDEAEQQPALDPANPFAHLASPDPGPLASVADVALDDNPFAIPLGDDGSPDPTIVDDMVLTSQSRGVPVIAPFDHWRDVPPPVYAIDGVLEHRGLACIIGNPGVGKSAVAIDMACSMVAGVRWQGRETIRQRVLYLPGEGLSGAVARIKAWELAHERNVGTDLILGNAIIQLGAAKEDWAEVAGYLLRHRVGMIIFDTYARMSLGFDENSATDMGRAIVRFDQIRNLTGAGVLVVHHTGKVGDSARGSSALQGALESELLLKHGGWEPEALGAGAPMSLSVPKQKNNVGLSEDEAIPLLLAPMHGSIVVTGSSGLIGDPLDTVSVATLLTPEPVVETAIRLAEFVRRFPQQGVTRAEFVFGVARDEYTAARRNADQRWRQAVAEAVDRGLRYGLLDTLTGRPTGTRYVAGSTEPDAARRRAAEEEIT